MTFILEIGRGSKSPRHANSADLHKRGLSVSPASVLIAVSLYAVATCHSQLGS